MVFFISLPNCYSVEKLVLDVYLTLLVPNNKLLVISIRLLCRSHSSSRCNQCTPWSPPASCVYRWSSLLPSRTTCAQVVHEFIAATSPTKRWWYSGYCARLLTRIEHQSRIRILAKVWSLCAVYLFKHTQLPLGQ